MSIFFKTIIITYYHKSEFSIHMDYLFIIILHMDYPLLLSIKKYHFHRMVQSDPFPLAPSRHCDQQSHGCAAR